MVTEDLRLKITRITKLGTPVRVHNKLKGVVLARVDDYNFRVSCGNSGVNWVDTLHIDEIELWNNMKRR